MSKRSLVLWAAAVVVVAVGVLVIRRLTEFPPDTTPEGAYLRIAHALATGEDEACFPYLEEEAQHAVFTIHGYAGKAVARIEATYPEAQKQQALRPYAALAKLEGGPAVWVELARRNGWLGRLRRDLSGVATVEQAGERATVITARGTRYSFRVRPNGIWGLTMFTAELERDAARFARDWEQIERAAADYERESKR